MITEIQEEKLFIKQCSCGNEFETNRAGRKNCADCYKKFLNGFINKFGIEELKKLMIRKYCS